MKTELLLLFLVLKAGEWNCFKAKKLKNITPDEMNELSLHEEFPPYIYKEKISRSPLKEEPTVEKITEILLAKYGKTFSVRKEYKYFGYMRFSYKEKKKIFSLTEAIVCEDAWGGIDEDVQLVQKLETLEDFIETAPKRRKFL